MKALGVFVDDTYPARPRHAEPRRALRRQQGYFARAGPPRRAGQRRPARSRRPSTSCSTGSAISPRLGVNLKLNESGTTLLKAHYGRYYRGIVTGEFDNTTPSITPRFTFSGLYDAAGQSARARSSCPTTRSLARRSGPRRTRTPISSSWRWSSSSARPIGFSRQLRLQAERAADGVPRHRRHLRAWCRITRPQGQTCHQVYQLTSGAASRLFQLDERRPHVLALQRRGVRAEEADVEPVAGQLRRDAVEEPQAGRGRARRAATPLDQRRSAPPASSARTRTTTSTADGRLIGDRPVVLKTQFIYQLPLGHDARRSTTRARAASPWGSRRCACQRASRDLRARPRDRRSSRSTAIERTDSWQPARRAAREGVQLRRHGGSAPCSATS